MRSAFLKSAKAAAVLIMAQFVLTSCQISENNAETEDTSVSSVSVTTSVTEPAEEPETEEPFDISSLKYDFSGLDSQKYIEIFADAHYTLKASITQNQIMLSQIMFVDAPGKRILFNYNNPAYSMSNYITENTMYYIAEGRYFSIDISGYNEDVFNSYAIYKKCGYIGSGTKELGGVSYKYDEYYDLEQDRSFMILMNENNDLEGILDAGMFTRISDLSMEFDESEFSILDGLTEISQEEFGELMASLNDGAQKDESNND